MGECLLIGKGIRGGTNVEKTLVCEVFSANTTWTPPPLMFGSTVEVTLFGGGGHSNSINGRSWLGGGGGYMNKCTITLNNKNPINIVVGGPAQPTKFGTYAMANAGENATNRRAGNGGAGGGVGVWYRPLNAAVYGGDGFQFGGGAAVAYNCSATSGTICYGGNGGIWGGGGGAYSQWRAYGGKGGTYGGGGMAHISNSLSNAGNNADNMWAVGGDGGTYGGGGMAISRAVTNSKSGGFYKDNATNVTGGKGGTYGGNGGTIFSLPTNSNSVSNVNHGKNGINTSTWTNVDTAYTNINQVTSSLPNTMYLRGKGLSMWYSTSNNFHKGGGGFGGNGYASGGGYGSIGYYGGGGYGSDGILDDYAFYARGGGGYGNNSLAGWTIGESASGGGGYFSNAGDGWMGGSGYGTYGRGGGGEDKTNPSGGICIIHYYLKNS